MAVADTGGDYARVEALLLEAGLCMPPMPDAALTRLKEREEGCFSTRAFKVPPSDIQHYVRKAMAGASPDYVLIAQSGRAGPAYAMHYFLVQGPLQLFLQIGWDESSAGRERSAALVNGCFALAHHLVEAIPEAIRRGRLSRDGRLTVVASEREGSSWEVARRGERGTQPTPHTRRPPRGAVAPPEILKQALRWCRGQT
jgi:hypothetical protein